MDVLKAIQKRREITQFQDKSLETEELERILDAGYLAPSGNNLPSKEMILVTDKEMLVHLSKTTPFVPWLGKAAAAVVVLGRPKVSKYWLQDSSITCGFIWLEATELGIGAAFGAIYHAEDAEESERRERYARKALDIPGDRRVVAILGLGYPEKEPEPKKLIERDSLIHYGKFS